MAISHDLKDARVRKKITQDELAEELGVSRQTISSWENGKSYPDIVSIIKLSNLYNISLDKLLKDNHELVRDMQKNMDVVKSNKSIIFTFILGIILFGGLYLIRTFGNLPKIDNITLNIIVLIIFIIGIVGYLLTTLNVPELLNKKTSNKTIVKTIISIIMVIFIFLLFPVIDLFITIEWQILIARVSLILVLVGTYWIVFNKIDKY